MLLDCAEIYPNAFVCYKSRDMVLHVDSDTEYLTMPEARIYYDGHFYLSDWPLPRPLKPTTKINGPIHTQCKTIYNMVYSAAEAKTCGTFNNGKNSYLHATRLHPTGPQAPSNTPQNRQLNHRRILNSGMKPKL